MKKYSVYLWAFIALSFMVFIGLMSYWYPVTLDEFFRWQNPFDFIMIKQAYFTQVPRISVFFGPLVFILGKWSFVLANSVIQLVNAFCLFYILFARLPNVKNFQDMPYFLMILCMSVFFISRPSEVLFWVSGAINYSWPILFFLLLLCFLRRIQAGKFIFKDNIFTNICFFVLGFIVGTSNEALSPIALAYIVCFGLFCNFKKIKTPRALSFMIFGVAIGCLVFFSAPAHYNKMNLKILSTISAIPLSKKLFFHLFHFNEFLKAQFFLPVLTAAFCLVAALDWDKRKLKDVDFLYTITFLVTGFLMAFILFAAPASPDRAYYAASVMNILAFLFLVKYFIKIYGYDFSKIICCLILGIAIYLTPRFVFPHYALHLQEVKRNQLIAENQPVAPYVVLKGPTYNLSIGFMDAARRIEFAPGVFATDVSPLEDW